MSSPSVPTDTTGNVYLVTGATGFLGHHLLPLILSAASADSARLLVRDPQGQVARALVAKYGRSITLVKGSLSDEEVLFDAARGCKGIFHLAGLVLHSRYSPEPLYQVNLDGTMAVMRAAEHAGNIKVVYASTSGVVGCSASRSQVATDSSPYCLDTVSSWPYYHSKVLAEMQAAAFAREKGITLLMMRPTMMFGPEDDRFRSTHTVLSFLERKLPLIPSGGASFVDVRDAAQAFHEAMIRPLESLLELFTMLEKVSGVRKPLIRYIPGRGVVWVAMGLDWVNRNVRGKWESSVDPVRAEMGSHWWNLDASKAKRDLGFSPRNPMTTLRDTVEWIKANQKLHAKL